ncbi:NADPH oxidase [Thecamonas trahens ATCC 50062]|uniref:NADPH oxidase n=1 Tax=Thecamonas trahens ATCC 50062 TaxID=461836 RepID=A0A0L0DLE6_THETB|nr:NADPH oxidase [Thecamonas trahens ATCC 50062]KNC53122.1 NADPH oxidase [Thecamonas trahens ATCC 50062]|eukprot:XP_013754789.1 NADPH oxidase [Thecamonas trahens ATCC 50062]
MLTAQRPLLDASAASYWRSLQNASIALESAKAMLGVSTGVCPITGMRRRILRFGRGMTRVATAWVFRPDSLIKRWAHVFAIASNLTYRLSRRAFARLTGWDAASSTVDLLFAILARPPPPSKKKRLSSRAPSVPLLEFLAFASAFAGEAPQKLRLMFVFLMAAGSTTAGAELSLATLCNIPHLILAAPGGAALAGDDLVAEIHSSWLASSVAADNEAFSPSLSRSRAISFSSPASPTRPVGSIVLDWPRFISAFTWGELEHATELTLHIHATPTTRQWRSWLTTHRTYSTVAFSPDAPLLAALLAVAEDLKLSPNVGRERAKLWMAQFALQELATVGDVLALEPAQWSSLATATDLPAGVLARLASYGISGSASSAAPATSHLASLRASVAAAASTARMHAKLDPAFCLWLALICLAVTLESVYIARIARSYAAHRILGASLVAAKVFAAGIRVGVAFLFLPVCLATYTTVVRVFLPRMPRSATLWLRPSQEHMMLFHRLGGVATFACALGHTAAHVVNAFRTAAASQADRDLAFAPGTPLAAFRTHNSPLTIVFSTWLGLSGILLLLLMLAIVPLAHPKIRRIAFEVFYYPHQLALVLPLLLVAHPTTLRTLYYIAPGYLLYLIARGISAPHALADARIVALDALPGSVVHVAFVKSARMTRALALGDYVHLHLPSISKLQWHPFSVASSPLMEHVHVYFKAVGARDSWTRQVYALAESSASGIEDPTSPASSLRLYVAGPFGSDPHPYLSYHRAVLIASGIGVTPYAAVLSDIIFRLQHGLALPLKHLHFWWVCRDLDSFRWFQDVLEVLESQFYTSIHEPDLTLDVRLFVTRDVFLALPFTDVVSDSGLLARPNAAVGVFFSGNSSLASAVYAATTAVSATSLVDYHFHLETCFTP